MSISQVNTANSSTPELVNYGDNSELDKMAFLKLLTVQLQNQDPLDPMDSQGMAQQQAMFAQVEQLMNLNSTMTGFMESQDDIMLGISGVFNTLQSTSFLGKEVAFFTNETYVTDEGVASPMYYDLTQDALVSYSVRDENGLVIKTTETRTVAPGDRIAIGWDGKDAKGKAVPAGKYTIDLKVQNTSGETLNGKTYSEVMVRSIDFRSGTPEMTLIDGRTLTAADILALSEVIGE